MLIECLVIWFQFLLLCIRAVNPLSQGCFGEGRLNKSVSILFAFPASDFERSAISQASLPGMCFLAGWAWASGMSLLLDPGTCLPLSRALVCLNIHNTTSCQPCEASVTHIKTVSRLQAPETWAFSPCCSPLTRIVSDTQWALSVCWINTMGEITFYQSGV